MEFREHLDQAMQLVAGLGSWNDPAFSWQKAYVCCVMSRLAYEVVPAFELKKTKRAKVIPCDAYQAHIARWETASVVPDHTRLDLNLEFQAVVRKQVIVTLSRVYDVIFIALRGTTLCYADLMADIDFRKTAYSWGFGSAMQLHQGFFEAVLECFDEVLERVRTLLPGRVEPPIYLTGHSLGGAVAAVFTARLAEAGYHPKFRPKIYPVPEATSCYTFGMPRYQDATAKALLPQPLHIFNELDLVPTLPPTMLGFADAPNERCLNAIPELTEFHHKGNLGVRRKSLMPTVLGVSDHRMERYLDRMDAMRLAHP